MWLWIKTNTWITSCITSYYLNISFGRQLHETLSYKSIHPFQCHKSASNSKTWIYMYLHLVTHYEAIIIILFQLQSTHFFFLVNLLMERVINIMIHVKNVIPDGYCFCLTLSFYSKMNWVVITNGTMGLYSLSYNFFSLRYWKHKYEILGNFKMIILKEVVLIIFITELIQNIQ